MSSTKEQIAVLGGIGSGKSWGLLYKIRELMRYQPYSIWEIGRNTLRDLKEDTYEICFGSDGLFNGLGKFDKTNNIFLMYNGSKIYFKHFDDPEAVRGPSISGVYIEQAEMVNPEVFRALTGRLRQWGSLKKGSQGFKYTEKFGKSPNHIHVPKHYLFLAANPGNSDWIKKEFIDKSEEELKNWEVILTTTYDNKDNLPPDYIDKMKAQHNDLWIQRNIYGSFEKAEGLVYSEFSGDYFPKGHLIDPIGTIHFNEQIYIAIDPGFQHASVAIFAIIRDGRLIVFDEVYEKNETASTVAEIINKRLKDRFLGKWSQFNYTWLIDPSANRKEMGTGQSIKSMYVDAGIVPIDADNESIGARHVIKDLLKQRKILVTTNCLNTIREFNSYKWHPTKLDQVVKMDDDAMDCIKYIVNYQPDWKSMPVKKDFERTPEAMKKAGEMMTKEYLTHVFNTAGEDNEPRETDRWGL